MKVALQDVLTFCSSRLRKKEKRKKETRKKKKFILTQIIYLF